MAPKGAKRRALVIPEGKVHRAVKLLPSVTPRSPWQPPRPHGDLTVVLTMLREAHVEVRTTTEQWLVWRPKPTAMAPELAGLVREHKLDLRRVLMAFKQGHVDPRRPLWSAGGVDACFGCGRGCVLRDPLGFCRHGHCGWLGQKLDPIQLPSIPQYPTFVGGQATWKS